MEKIEVEGKINAIKIRIFDLNRNLQDVKNRQVTPLVNEIEQLSDFLVSLEQELCKPVIEDNQ